MTCIANKCVSIYKALPPLKQNIACCDVWLKVCKGSANTENK